MSRRIARSGMLAGACAAALVFAPAAASAAASRPISGEAYRRADAGFRAYAAGRYAEAAREAQRAVALRPDIPRLQLLLVRALVAAKQPASASEAGRRAERAGSAGPELREELSRLRNATPAISPPIRTAAPEPGYAAAARAYAALAAGRAADAVQPARQATREAPGSADARRLLVDALSGAGRRDEAAAAAREALAATGPDARLQARLGYLESSAGRSSEAAAAFAAALALGHPELDRGALTLALSDARAASGDLPGGLQALGAADPAEAYPIASRRAALLLRLDRKAEALPAVQRAMALAPPEARTDLRASEVELLAAAGRRDEARARLALAAASDEYAPGREAQLAELAIRVNDDRSAQALFARARAKGSLRDTIVLDAAYVNKRRADNAAAYALFAQALQEDAAGPKALAPDFRIKLGREAYELDRSWGVNAALLSGAAVFAAPGVGGAAASGEGRTTQVGGEIYWRPPVIGYRNARTVDVFARGFATLQDDAGGFTGGESVQAYAGVRWKPFTSQTLVLEGSRLIAIGDGARNDWLLRAAWSHERGLDTAESARSRWAMQTYAEVDRLFDPGQTLVFSYLRVGRAFRLGPRLVVTPLVDASVSWDELGAPRTAAGIGPGVGVRYRIGSDRELARSGYVELNIGRRFKLTDADRADGLFATLSVVY